MNLHYYILRTMVASLMLVAAHTLGAQCAVSLNASVSPGVPQSCNGTDGVLTITFSNGTPPYQYTLQHNGVPLLTDITSNNEVVYTDLASGLYQISVIDFTGCTAVNAVALTTTPPISLALSTSVSNLPPGVCNGANGILTMTATGTPPFDFAYQRLTGPVFLVTSSQNTVVVPDLPPGNYSVTVTDNFWFCSATSSIIVANTPPLSVTLSTINPSCGQNNGSAVSTVSGGTPPYSYLWSHGLTTPAISSLQPGAYSLTATDANGCTATGSAILGNSSPLVSIAGTNNTACEGTPMQFTGVSPGINTWFWTDGTVITASQTLSFIASPPGVYTYTVTAVNASGCTGTASVSLTVLPSPTATITGNTTICTGGSTVLTAGGGSVYLWSTGATTAEITVNPSTITTYAVTVSYGGLCSSSTFIVVQPVVSAIVEVINDNCEEGSSGSVSLTDFGGQLPHAYLWSNGATTPDLTGVPAGTYTVTVTETGGCTNSASGTVGAAMQLSTVINEVDCFGAASGSIDLSVINGLEPYTYIWSNGSTAQDLLNLSAGIYTVTVSDFNNCTQSIPVTIFQPAPIIITPMVTPITCANGLSGAISITVTGGTAPYTYLWLGPDGFTSTASIITSLSTSGTYEVAVTDTNGCFAVWDTTLTSPGLPFLNFSVTNAICGGGNGAINLTIFSGSGNYSYLWSTGETIQNLTNLIPGEYWLTVTDLVSGCNVFDTATVQTTVDITITGGGNTVSCGNPADGIIDLTVSGQTAPFTFLWSNGPSTEDITGLTPGIYTVTITDINGCFKIRTYSVLAPSNFLILYTTLNPGCSGDNTGIIAPTVFGTTPPYSFDWAHIPGSSDPQSLSGLSAGIYQVTITDVEGCTNDTTIIISAPQPLVFNIAQVQSCGSTTISILSTTGGTPPYAYSWNTGAIGPINVANISGTFTVTVVDANGCSANQSIIVEVISGNSCSFFSGKVVIDANLNCANDAETGLAHWIVRATGNQTFYALTDSDGYYNIGVAPGENYMIEAIPPGSLWAPCPPAFLVAPVIPDTITGVDLPIEQILLCAELEVNLYSGNIRRCVSSNHYSISYCNNGTAPAEDAYIILSMDAFSSPVSSNLPFTNLGNNNFRFNIGDVAIGACNTFNVFFAVNCDAVIGQTVCATAHIYPDSICLPPNAQWSGASLALSSQCAADSLHFTIKNVGFGPMAQALEYFVVEDHVMLFALPVLLNPNETKVVTVPSNGSTWRIAVPQEPFHPGNSQPSLTVEGCTTNSTFSTGFVNQFAQNEADPWIDVWCAQITAAFDPNDKQGFPTGYSNEHYVAPGTQLEYGIRFQNTGNDTAFIVRLVDTLSQWLDPATIRPGSASHPYTFDLNGTGIATFTFDNILLPDSNVNEVASHGFVKFTILPKTTTPLETVINNTAGIYFDFNDPIFTNTTFHKIGDHFLTVGLWQPEDPAYEVLVSPNPSSGNASITVKGLTHFDALQLEVSDMYGRLVMSQQSTGDSFLMSGQLLPAGVYYFRIMQEGKLVGNGKILVEL